MSNSNNVINRLTRLQDLCTELLETLTVALSFIKDYTEEYEIPIPNRKKLAYLLQKTILLLEECGLPLNPEEEKSRKLPLRKSNKRSPEDLPEPLKEMFNSFPSYFPWSGCNGRFSSTLLKFSNN